MPDEEEMLTVTGDHAAADAPEGCGECLPCLLRKFLAETERITDGFVLNPEGLEPREGFDNVIVVRLPASALAAMFAPPGPDTRDTSAPGMLIEELLDESTLEFVNKQKAKAQR